MTTKNNTPTPGEELVASILADMADNSLAPDSRETELLENASATTDKIAVLEMAVAQAGMTFVDKDGVTRPSPLLAEIRHLTLVLTRCLNGIQLDPGKAGKDPAKSRAGQASWAARSGRDLRGAVPRAHGN
jgi:hypothetical protein